MLFQVQRTLGKDYGQILRLWSKKGRASTLFFVDGNQNNRFQINIRGKTGKRGPCYWVRIPKERNCVELVREKPLQKIVLVPLAVRLEEFVGMVSRDKQPLSMQTTFPYTKQGFCEAMQKAIDLAQWDIARIFGEPHPKLHRSK